MAFDKDEEALRLSGDEIGSVWGKIKSGTRSVGRGVLQAGRDLRDASIFSQRYEYLSPTYRDSVKTLSRKLRYINENLPGAIENAKKHPARGTTRYAKMLTSDRRLAIVLLARKGVNVSGDDPMEGEF
jgi:hypothetical protein